MSFDKLKKKLGLNARMVDYYKEKGYLPFSDDPNYCLKYILQKMGVGDNVKIDDLLAIDQAASLTGFCSQKIRHAIDRKAISSYRVGVKTRLYVNRKEIENIDLDAVQMAYISRSTAFDGIAMDVILFAKEVGWIRDLDFKILSDINKNIMLTDIAKEVGLSRERVRQLVVRARATIRESLEGVVKSHKQPEIDKFSMLREIQQLKKENSLLKTKLSKRGSTSSLSKYDILISKLDFSLRTYNCLCYAKINTLVELSDCSRTYLLKLRNFGKTSLKEVESKLESYGLKLAS